MKTVHALLVGIDEYKNISGLDAAVSDSQRFEEYLKENAPGNFNPNIRTLHDDQATKEAIVAAFEEQLIDLNPAPEDVLLFYFSGHGTQEFADEVFSKSEPGQKLESLACYDADLESAKGFMADKEMRWLIHRATQSGAHFLNISDCCHSGDNTRGVTVDEIPKAKKRLCASAKQRAWEDFVFHDKIKYEAFKNHELDDVIPQGKHISIAACRNVESAFEVVEGGIFTSGLLKFLEREKGDISYFDLKTRVGKFVKSQYEQSPQIYCSGEDQTALFQTFLGGAIKDKPAYANVSYNWQERRWELDIGAIYGVTKMWNDAPQQVIVTNHVGEQLTANITEVLPGESIIRFEPYSDIRKSEQYRAFVPSMMTRRLNVSLRGEEEGVSFLKKNISTQKLEEAGIRFLGKDENVDFTILAKNEEYLVTLPGDDRPLTSQEEGYRTASAENILKKLQKIGKWSFVKNLKNEDSSLSEDNVKVEVFQNKNSAPLKKDIVTLDVSPDTLKTPIKIKLTNNSGKPLHVGMVYLSSLFGMSPKLIQGQVIEVNGGEEVWARGGQYINLSLESYIQDFNWEYEVFYTQIIFATSEFGIELYLENDLEAPRSSKNKGITRGMDDDEWAEEKPDWQTRLIEFRLKNPNYKTS